MIDCSGVRRIYFSRGRPAPEGREKIFCPPVLFSAPPAELNSAPGAEQTIRGGRKPYYT